MSKLELDKIKLTNRLLVFDEIPLPGEKVDNKFKLLIGGLLYISNMSRPDISIHVSKLSRFLDQSYVSVWKVAVDVLRYLVGTKELVLHLGKLDDTNLTVYVDSSFGDNGTRKAQTGTLIQLNGSSIGWISKRQKTTSKSSTEAEYVAHGTTLDDVLWTQNHINELNYPSNFP